MLRVPLGMIVGLIDILEGQSRQVGDIKVRGTCSG